MLTKLKLFLVKVISIIFPLFKITRIQYNLIEALTIKKNNYKIDKSSDKLIRSLKIKDKISVLDVGAQDGFFLPGNFSNLNFKKYLSFLNIILVEPNKREAEKLKSKNFTLIKNGFWSKKCKKKLFITGKNPGGSSMYLPDKQSMKLYSPDKKYLDLYKVTGVDMINCVSANEALKKLKVKKLDYFKIDSQGAELEILKGLKNYYPLMIKLELQIFKMYKNIPNWSKVTDYLYDKDYMICAWERNGGHMTHAPVAMDALFIPNFLTKKGKLEILKRKNTFIFLMVLFGQIRVLKHIAKELNFKIANKIYNLKDTFFH